MGLVRTAIRLPLVLLVALPGAALALATAGILLLALFGRHPFWPVVELTLSEATALHDRGDVTRLTAAGVDPDGMYSVRPGILNEETHVLTPLQTAVMARQPDMIPLLVERGAGLDVPTWGQLSCLAKRLDVADVQHALERLRPAGASSSCDDGAPAR
jgi:hypothetical protein